MAWPKKRLLLCLVFGFKVGLWLTATTSTVISWLLTCTVELINFSFSRQAMNKQNVFEVEKVMKEFETIIEKYPTCSETYGLYAQVCNSGCYGNITHA